MKPFERPSQPLALVVDDDPVVRAVVSQSLVRAGLRVREADCAERVLEWVKDERPDIVLLDVVLPGMSGFDACRRLRSTANFRHVPILMLTSLDDVESINRAYEAGATDFIGKPINWAVLPHRVRYMLRASETFGALVENQAMLYDAQRIARLGSWSWDFRTGANEWSDETFSVLGYAPGEVAPGMDALIQRVHPSHRDAALGYVRALGAGERAAEASYRLELPDGQIRHVRVHSDLRMSDDGDVIGALGTLQDITESKLSEERIHRLAFYDGLTTLPNRRLFMENVAQALNRARRHNRAASVLSLDLDNFKRINDTLGHSAGDRLLEAVAVRLRDGLRAYDEVAYGEGALGIARLGGDEFCILLNDINQFDDAAKVAARIVRSFAQSIVIGDNELFITASVGIAVFPNDGEDPETLLKNADAAMYHAKSQGRNNYQFYGRAMNARASEKLAMEAQLRKAIERNEFEIHLQPKLDLRSDRIAGAEALIRWRHPERGMVLPGDFIPLAEQGGLIVPIGEWVLQAACQESMTWLQAGLPPTPVAVNISGLHFRHRTLLSTVAKVLENTGLPPQLLELELTESILMEDMAATLATLRSLKGMGLRLSIDDFGTGYSSLAYLKRFPLDALKVDRSFVKDMSAAADDTAIPSAIIAMAHSLKLEVVAEGVETQEQMAFLKERGCEYAQGYFIGRPMAPKQLTAMLERSARSAPD